MYQPAVLENSKQIFAELKAIGKTLHPLVSLYDPDHQDFSKHFADEIQIIVPPRRIHFEKLVDGKPIENWKSRCNFDCLYYCWKMNLPTDLVWLSRGTPILSRSGVGG